MQFKIARNKSAAGRAIRPRGSVTMRQQRQLGYFPITPCVFLPEALCGSLRRCPEPFTGFGGKTCYQHSRHLYTAPQGFT